MKKIKRSALFLLSVFAFTGIVYGQSDTTMVVTSSGEVGIGTVTPAEKFSVVGGRILVSRRGDFLVDPSAQWGDETMRISDTDAQLAFYSLASGAGSGGIFMKEVDGSGLLNNQWLITRTTGASSLNFTFGTEADFSTDVKIMTVHSSGNVGIGIATPQTKFSVNGRTHIFGNGDTDFSLEFSSPIDLTIDDSDTGFEVPSDGNLAVITDNVEKMRITKTGEVGIGVTNPNHPLEMASGAHVTAGGVWTDASSRTLKENIQDLTTEQALEAFMQLSPKQYNYIRDSEESHLGFIAEEVPDIVAMNNRKSLSSMDIVALLTKVVQEQQSKISELESRLNANY